MAINVLETVWRLELPAGQKLVALALADHARADGGEARPSIATLEKKTGFNRSTIIRHLAALLQRGVIGVDKRATPVAPTIYKFIIPLVPAKYGGAQNATGGSQSGDEGVAISFLRGCKMQPKPLEPSFITITNERYQPLASLEAYKTVKAHMQKIGGTGKPDLSIPIIKMVVERIGWHELFAMQPYERNQCVRDLIDEVL